MQRPQIASMHIFMRNLCKLYGILNAQIQLQLQPQLGAQPYVVINQKERRSIVRLSIVGLPLPAGN